MNHDTFQQDKTSRTSRRLNLALAAAAISGAVIGAGDVPALAAPHWDAITLTPPETSAMGFAGAAGRQVGQIQSTITWSPSRVRPAIWEGSAASYTDLTPTTAQGGSIFATDGSQHGGYIACSAISTAPLATLWRSSHANDFVILQPAGAVESQVRGVGGGKQVGFVTTATQHGAALWNGTPESFVNLHPLAFSISNALATDGVQQVGNASVGNTVHAALWTGSTGSFVDLAAGVSSNASANGVAAGEQVGYADQRPVLWKGTALSMVNLTPSFQDAAGFGSVNDTIGGAEAGQVQVNGAYHAVAWFGSAGSAVDLQAFLDPARGYFDSYAFGIARNGDVIEVSGYASRLTPDHDVRFDAVLWTTVIPESTFASASALIALGALLRRRRRATTLYRQSPAPIRVRSSRVICAMIIPLTGATLSAAVRYNAVPVTGAPDTNGMSGYGLAEDGRVTGDGQIIGVPNYRAMEWSAASGGSVLPVPGNTVSSFAGGSTANGDVVGSWRGPNDDERAVYWSGGVMHSLPSPYAFTGVRLSSANFVIGYAFNEPSKLLMWRDRQLVATFSDLPDTWSGVSDVNDAGHFVGTYYDQFYNVFAMIGDTASKRLFAFPGVPNPWLAAINNLDMIAGSFSNETGERAFVARGQSFTTLDPLLGDSYSRAVDLDDDGTVLGISSRDGYNTERAVIYEPGSDRPIDLTSITDGLLPNLGLTYAWHINNAGQLLVEAGDGQDWLLTPLVVPEPSHVGLLTAMALVSRRGGRRAR